MNTRRLDALFCNWPILGLFVIPVVLLTNNFQKHPILEISFSIFYGGGWILALIYAFYRLSQQQWQAKRVILWVLGLLWFSVFTLPLFYWQHLRKACPNA